MPGKKTRDIEKLLVESLPGKADLKTMSPSGRSGISHTWDLQDKLDAGGGINIQDVYEVIREDPLDADAWAFTHIFDLRDETKLELFERGVIAGETFLGDQMETEVGNFWSLLHTRPYMRCMNMLYRQLVIMKRPAEALAIGEEMLRLCPRDNIGIRSTIDDVIKSILDPQLADAMSDRFKTENTTLH